MQGKIKVGLQTSGGSYTKIFRKNKKNRPSKHLLVNKAFSFHFAQLINPNFQFQQFTLQ